MKKYLLIGLVFLSFTACTKKALNQDSTGLPEVTSSVNAKPVINYTVYLGWDTYIYDSCANETIFVSGLEVISVRQTHIDDRTVWSVSSHPSNDLSAIGIESNTVYSLAGSITQESFNELILDGTNQQGFFKASAIRNIKFSSKGHSLSITQTAHYVLAPNGTVTVDFSNSEVSCK